MDRRLKMLEAMKYIVSHVNDDDVLYSWHMCGIPDGKIDMTALCDDECFSEVMGEFLRTMKKAEISGGLYCDCIVSE